MLGLISGHFSHFRHNIFLLGLFTFDTCSEYTGVRMAPPYLLQSTQFSVRMAGHFSEYTGVRMAGHFSEYTGVRMAGHFSEYTCVKLAENFSQFTGVKSNAGRTLLLRVHSC